MPTFVKAILYVVVFCGLLILIGQVGPKDRDAGLAITFVWVAWIAAGLLIAVRGLYRFITR
jgi:hypothetical protein